MQPPWPTDRKVTRNSSDQPSSTDRHHDRVDRFELFEQLHPDRALAVDHFDIVVGRDPYVAVLVREGRTMSLGLDAVLTDQLEGHAAGPHVLDLDRGRCLRHEQLALQTEEPDGMDEGRAVIPGRRRDQELPRILVRKRQDRVQDSAELE